MRTLFTQELLTYQKKSSVSVSKTIVKLSASKYKYFSYRMFISYVLVCSSAVYLYSLFVFHIYHRLIFGKSFRTVDEE